MCRNVTCSLLFPLAFDLWTAPKRSLRELCGAAVEGSDWLLLSLAQCQPPSSHPLQLEQASGDTFPGVRHSGTAARAALAALMEPTSERADAAVSCLNGDESDVVSAKVSVAALVSFASSREVRLFFGMSSSFDSAVARE